MKHAIAIRARLKTASNAGVRPSRAQQLENGRRSENSRHSRHFIPPQAGLRPGTARIPRAVFRCALAILILLAAGVSLDAQSLTDEQLSNIRFDQKLNTRISLDLPFRDESGKTVTLGNYFGEKPVVLVLGYYTCPMLCTLTFNGMVESMEDMKWSIGDQFNVVHVSIDPKETSELALAKKRTYLKRYGRPGADSGWHFLTGDEPQIKQLCDEVGFHYAYDPTVKQYAHPSGLIILTPEGKVSKYFFGVTFSSPELFAALQQASTHKVGSPIEQLLLLCFHYSPIHGKYGVLIMTLLRVFGAVTLAIMAWAAVVLFRRDKQRRLANLEPCKPEPMKNTQ